MTVVFSSHRYGMTVVFSSHRYGMTVVFSIAIIKNVNLINFHIKNFTNLLCRRVTVIIVVEKLTIGGKIEFI
jgi:hypothetical protein